MGCTSSAKPDVPCSQEQKEELFLLAVKDMILLCVGQGLKQVDKISEPKELEDIRSIVKVVETLPGAKKQPSSPRGKDNKNNQSMSSKAMNAAKSVKDKAEKLVGGDLDALTKNLLNLLDTEKKQEQEFCDALREFSSEALVTRKDDLAKLFDNDVQAISIVNVFELVRGASPYGPDEYASCKSDAVCDLFFGKSRPNIVEGLKKEFDGNEKFTKLVQSWSKLAETFQTLNTKLAKVNPTMKKPPIKIDIAAWVFDKLLDQLSEVMSREEKFQRDLTNRDIAERPLPAQKYNFDICFNGTPTLDEFSKKHYDSRFKRTTGKE